MTRYGIGEWYGTALLALTPAERMARAQVALGTQPVPRCPFRPITCNKIGGVCTLQAYEDEANRPTDEGPVIVCPSRFEQGQLLIRWLADIVGFPADGAQVAREVPFMRGANTDRHAGKIDLVVANEQRGDLRWFGLEIQAVYFSGAGMRGEFEALRDNQDPTPPFPVGIRRPDWRSSSAKRLMPQLQVKGPTLRRWHSKIAVAVDRPFFRSLGGPSDNSSQDLDAGDVIWLVPELRDGNLLRGHWEVLTLEASEERLLAARTVNRADFENALRARLRPLRELG